jgi:hypothetical protein
MSVELHNQAIRLLKKYGAETLGDIPEECWDEDEELIDLVRRYAEQQTGKSARF